MKTFRKFISFLLATSLALVSLPLDGFSLLEPMSVLAAEVTDVYKAYKELLENYVEYGEDAVEATGSMLNTDGTTRVTVAGSDESPDMSKLWKLDQSQYINGVMNGWFTFEQKGIDASAQVKSGKWTNGVEEGHENQTVYEAMTGTPTTEPLFVQMGGSQWIVDLQYRVVQSTYVRKYHFDAGVANYLYYTAEANANDEKSYLDTVPDPDTPGNRYQDTPEEWGDWNVDNETFKQYTNGNYSWLVANNGGEKVTVKNYKNQLIGDLIVDGRTYRYNKTTNGWANYSTDGTLARYDTNTQTTDFDKLSPDRQYAIQCKKEIANIILAWQNAYDNQNDNYRADQGLWDSDYDDIPDKLSWQYTYYSMVRTSSIAKTAKDGADEQFTRDGNWADPYIVSYLYDWQVYDTETYDYPSRLAKLPKLKDIVPSLSEQQNLVLYFIQNQPSSFAYRFAFPMNPNESPLSATYQQELPADYSYLMSFIYGTSLLNVWPQVFVNTGIPSFWYSYIDKNKLGELYAFGAPLLAPEVDGIGFNISRGMVGSDLDLVFTGNKFYPNNSYMSFDETGSDKNWFDTPCLYFTSLYSLYFNYGWMFYEDELLELFGDIPCVETSAGVNTIQNVNMRLMMIFGADSTKDVNCKFPTDSGADKYVIELPRGMFSFEMKIPMAVLPPGGNLDSRSQDDLDPERRPQYSSDSFLDNEQPDYIQDLAKNSLFSHALYRLAVNRNIVYLDFQMLFSRSNQYYSNYAHDYAIDDYHNDVVTTGYAKPDANWENDWAKETTPSWDYDFFECLEEPTINAHNPHVCADMLHYYNDRKVRHTTGCEVTGPYDSRDHGDMSGSGWMIDYDDEGDPYITRCTHCPDGHHQVVRCKSHVHLGDWTSYRDAPGVNPETAHSQFTKGTMKSHDDGRVFREYWTYSTSSSAKTVYQYFTPEIASMSYSSTIGQQFENVQWIDIGSYNIWMMNSGYMNGLATLLAVPVTSDSQQKVLHTAVVDQLGYKVYNIDDQDGVQPSKGISNIGDRDNLQKTGRVANSFNFNSQGNMNSPRTHFERSGESGYTGIQKATVMSSWINDVPLIGKFWQTVTSNNIYMKNYYYVNWDAHAFYLDKTKSDNSGTDDLYFRYNPYSQGGRSHVDFDGFINQALARTLYFATTSTDMERENPGDPDSVRTDAEYGAPPNKVYPDIKPVKKSESYKVAYSNSIRIQGDYMGLDYLIDPEGEYSTAQQALVGYLYDTWEERNDLGYSGGKFRLIQDNVTEGNNILAQFYCRCAWVPARLSYLLARSSKDSIYAYSNVTSVNNCWVIHTFCNAINGEYHTSWDCIDGDLGEVNCSFAMQATSGEGAKTEKGDVRKNMGEDGCIDLVDLLISPSNDNLNHITLTYWITQEVARPTKLGSESEDAEDADGAGSMDGDIDANIVTTDIKPYEPYQMLVDTFATSQPTFNRDTHMYATISAMAPYVGYGADGTGMNGTSMIVGELYTGDNRQQPGFAIFEENCKFDVSNSFVENGYSPRTPNSNSSSFAERKRTFRDFGIGKANRPGTAKMACDYIDVPYVVEPVYYNTGKSGIGSIADGDEDSYLHKQYETHTGVANGDKPFGARSDTESGKYITQTTPTEKTGFSSAYPWLQYLNVNRYLGNDRYSTGKAVIGYEEVGIYASSLFPNNAAARVHVNNSVDKDKFYYNTGVYDREDNSKRIFVNASYEYKDNYTEIDNFNGNPNDIVIYNPVSTYSAHVVKESDYLPDQVNKGMDAEGNTNPHTTYLMSFLDFTARDGRSQYHYTMHESFNVEDAMNTYKFGSGFRNFAPDKEIGITFVAKTLRPYSLQETLPYGVGDYEITYDTGGSAVRKGTDGNWSMTIDTNEKYAITYMRTFGRFISSDFQLQAGDILRYDAANNNLLLRTQDEVHMTSNSFYKAYAFAFMKQYTKDKLEELRVQNLNEKHLYLYERLTYRMEDYLVTGNLDSSSLWESNWTRWRDAVFGLILNTWFAEDNKIMDETTFRQSIDKVVNMHSEADNQGIHYTTRYAMLDYWERICSEKRNATLGPNQGAPAIGDTLVNNTGEDLPLMIQIDGSLGRPGQVFRVTFEASSSDAIELYMEYWNKVPKYLSSYGDDDLWSDSGSDTSNQAKKAFQESRQLAQQIIPCVPYTSNGTITFVFECKANTHLQYLPFTLKDGASVKISRDYVENLETVLMHDTGNNSSKYKGKSWWYYGGSILAGGTTNPHIGKAFSNRWVGTKRGQKEVPGWNGDYEAGYIYISTYAATVGVKLRDDAVQDPHRVLNSNWRYYVLGWVTDKGHVVTSISDPVLSNNNTVLMYPGGYAINDFYNVGEGRRLSSENSITVGTLVNLARNSQLGIYAAKDGTYGLIPLRTGSLGQTYEHYSRYTGISTGRESSAGVKAIPWKFYNFSDSGDNHIEWTGVVHPLEFFQPDPSDTEDIAAITNLIRYEGVFLATDGDGLAYDVKYSQNTAHKYSSEDTTPVTLTHDIVTADGEVWHAGETIERWKLDWDDNKNRTTRMFDKKTYDALFARYLSLDDEFTIYWDNFADFSLCSNTSHNIADTRFTLGRGWNNTADAQEAPQKQPGKAPVQLSFDFVKNYPFWSEMDDAANPRAQGHKDPIDTTKWIYNKYVVFNVDMYAFSEEATFVYDDTKIEEYIKAGYWDPTTPAYKATWENGQWKYTINHIVYIPAGQKVYLGYYAQRDNNPANKFVGASDDDARFIDFGCNATYKWWQEASEEERTVYNLTKDPNGNLYTYHFWVPLAVGESDETVSVTYCVNAINSVEYVDEKYKSEDQTYDGEATPNVYPNAKNPDTTYVSAATHLQNNIAPNKPGTTEKTKYDMLAEEREGQAIPKNAGTTVGAPQDPDDDAYRLYDEWGVELVKPIEYALYYNDAGLETVSAGTGVTEAPVYSRYSGIARSENLSIKGSIGEFTVYDTGDPRYQDSFKVPAPDAEYAIAPIVQVVDTYTNKYVSNPDASDEDKERVPGGQRHYLQDLTDVRGRALVNVTDKNTGDRVDYVPAMSANSYRWNDYARGSAASWCMEAVKDTKYVPMTQWDQMNVHSELNHESFEPVKLGYDLFCSLSTIGNYFGSRGQRTNDPDEEPSNTVNYDYGSNYVYIQPIYVAIHLDENKNVTTYPVDAYMFTHNNYYCINAAPKLAGEDETAPTVSDTYNYNMYSMKLLTNDAGLTTVDGVTTHALNQLMQRYSITDAEAQATYNVVHGTRDVWDYVYTDEDGNEYHNYRFLNGVTSSILDDYGDIISDTNGIDLPSVPYVYGNAQIMRLREYNRTFIGGTSRSLKETLTPSIGYLDEEHLQEQKDYIQAISDQGQAYAQKWYFNVGLPASTVFVKHGDKVTEKNILHGVDSNGANGDVILCLLRIIACGEKYNLDYKSLTTQLDIGIPYTDEPIPPDKWNPHKELYPDLIPVVIYDLSRTTAEGDLDSAGSH